MKNFYKQLGYFIIVVLFITLGIYEYRIRDNITPFVYDSDKPNEYLFTYTPDSPQADYDSSKDGKYSVYVVKAYDQGFKRYIDAYYFQTLTDKAAVLYRINSGGCLFSPELKRLKNQIIKEISSFSDHSEQFNQQYYELDEKYGLDCFPSGTWIDVNESPAIKVFEVNLKKPIVVSYYIDQYDFNNLLSNNFGIPSIPWNELKDVTSNEDYSPMGFSVNVSGGKIIEMHEIYRP
jgi:hypothetical protein